MHHCSCSPVSVAPAAMARGVALLALLLALVGGASSALLAIDYGSEFIKMALVAPGRTPISIVNNEISKRKSPAAVSFINGERALGDEASALSGRYPDRVFYRTRDLLGKPAASADVIDFLKTHYLPYDVKPDAERGMVMLHADGVGRNAEEVAASVLHYAKLCAEAQASSPIKDVVITVPAFFSQAQRQGLLDAAEIAGLNVMSLVSEHAAAAIQYGIDKDFTNTTEYVVRCRCKARWSPLVPLPKVKVHEKVHENITSILALCSISVLSAAAFIHPL